MANETVRPTSIIPGEGTSEGGIISPQGPYPESIVPTVPAWPSKEQIFGPVANTSPATPEAPKAPDAPDQ